MANKKDNTKRYDVAHLRNLARYRAQVDAIYRTLTKEAAAIAAGIDTEMPEDVFSFADYPKTMKRVDALIAKYKADMQKVIVNGVKSEWTLANNKNNELARQVFGDKAGKLTAEQERRYFKNNDTAREAFLGRKERGLSLSDRVWNYSDKFKNEIELGVDLCLRKGMPAAEMARELQKYLKHPNELFRRVREKHGVLKLSQAAKDFHPGRGVYRSSYKNALRLAITETNMAYRLADWERWQQMDFVVGIRIQLSNNHTCLGADGNPHPFYDICDELEGEYPKTFKWVGWHPQCRCNAVPIMKTVDEKIADNIAKRNGQAPAKESVNSVKRMPKAFTDWLKDNKSRIAAAKSQPYFIRDNATAVAKIIPGVLPESMAPDTPVIPIAERAQMRHDARTPEEIADNAADKRNQQSLRLSPEDYAKLKQSKAEVQDWAKGNIPQKAGLSIKGENIKSGELIVLRGSIRSTIEHTYDIDIVNLLRDIERNVLEFKWIGWRPTRQGKHYDAEYFNYYEFEVNGRKYYANVKINKFDSKEYLYCIYSRIDVSMLMLSDPENEKKK